MNLVEMINAMEIEAAKFLGCSVDQLERDTLPSIGGRKHYYYYGGADLSTIFTFNGKSVECYLGSDDKIVTNWY